MGRLSYFHARPEGNFPVSDFTDLRTSITTGYNQKSITTRKPTYVQRLYVLELELNVVEITMKIFAVYPIYSRFVAETVRLKCTYLFI